MAAIEATNIVTLDLPSDVAAHGWRYRDEHLVCGHVRLKVHPRVLSRIWIDPSMQGKAPAAAAEPGEYNDPAGTYWLNKVAVVNSHHVLFSTRVHV